MRQQVNLLPGDLGRRRRRPLAHYLVAAGVLFLVTLGAGGSYLAYRVHVIETTVVTLRAAEADNRDLLEQLRASVARRVPSADLLDTLERRRGELATRTALRNSLIERRLGNTAGFSPLLTGLAELKPETLWLRRILFDAGGRLLDLQGSALDPAAIPVYLQRFAGNQALSGRQVHRLEITRPDARARHVDFSLVTEHRP